MKDKLNPKGRIRPLHHGEPFGLLVSQSCSQGDYSNSAAPNSSASRTSRENNSSDYFDLAATRRSADMAVQHRLGLLPKRRPGLGPAHRCHSRPRQKNLATDTSSRRNATPSHAVRQGRCRGLVLGLRWRRRGRRLCRRWASHKSGYLLVPLAASAFRCAPAG
jgi:hypothetical protein